MDHKYSIEEKDKGSIIEYKKPNLAAFFLSGIFSGTGYFYIGEWEKGVAFSGLEILLWLERDDYLNKNTKDVDLYKEFADTHWTFEKWINDYYSFNDPENPMYNAFTDNVEYKNPWEQSHGIKFYYNTNNSNIFNTSSAEFEVIYETWCGDENGENYESGCLNEIDNFANNITIINDHHHYEGIGKYNLYFAGWDDANIETGWIDTLDNNYRIAYSNNKFYYEKTLRNKAKSSSDSAENMLTAIFITHATSMIDILLNYSTKNKLNLHSNINVIDENKNVEIGLRFSW